ncbi:MAG: ADP-ribosylglycohydrolase family protein [Ferruginibacter sp.]
MKYTTLAIGMLFCLCIQMNAQQKLSISKAQLRDKIAGGWAGKMIGVTYGAPVEFRALGKTYEDSIYWTPKDIPGSLWQDDIYVQLTFMMTMDEYGINAPAVKFQEMFAKAGYMLWHANVQARKNYYDNIYPPASGNPQYNTHADDIDFQIEADYLGFMCPGMPNTAMRMADKIGHIMNYGDGVYGGVFLAALNSHAFFENDIPTLINKALQSIPAKSDYAKIVQDVIALHKKYPNNWRSAWKPLQAKWGYDHFCEAGSDFNIDAKLNGAYIVMGLLYGDGDINKTLEISTRCGQDADCNPSSAMAVLGVIKGYQQLPENIKAGIEATGDSLFIKTNYSFNKAVDRTYYYATEMIKQHGGKIIGDQFIIQKENPLPAKFEVAFPNMILDKKVSIFDNNNWQFNGNWATHTLGMQNNEPNKQAKFSATKGDAITIDFDGTGISINGNWVKDGGKADVYIDGKFSRTINTYFYYNNQEHTNISLWHVIGLKPGKHQVKLVVKGEKQFDSKGSNVYITGVSVYKMGKKMSSVYKID